MKNYKRFIILPLVVVAFFAFIIKVSAATLSVKISASSDKVVVGDTVTYTVTVSSGEKLGSIIYNFTYDSSMLEWKSGETKSVYVTPDGNKKSATFTFKFKAKASGSTTVKFNINEAIDFNDNAFSYNSSTSKTTTIITQKQLTESYSKNNYLSKLGIDGFELSPTFDKDKLEYSLEVENEVRSINVTGAKADSKATVTGLGTHELEEGSNKINVVVTAQNGSSRTYVINVTVKELAPILVEANGLNLSVVRKKDQLTAPNSNFVETIIKINDEEVPAFTNEALGMTLVGLKDDEGNVSLYSYKDESYMLYKEFTFSNIIVTNINCEDIPDGYEKGTVKIGEEEINAYHLKDDEEFYLFNATNVSTGEKNLYQYNVHENTVQIFNENLLSKIDEVNKQKQNYMYVIIGLGVVLIVTYIAILLSSLKKKNNVKLDEIDKKESKKAKKDKEIEQNEEKDDKIKEDISKEEKGKK